MEEDLDSTPRITSHPPHSQVHSRLLLVNGTCGTSADAEIQISFDHEIFPTQSFPVRAGKFKALIHLSPGENTIKLTCFDGTREWVSSWPVTYTPLLQNPPLHLCIIVGSDSPLTYDDVPDAEHPANLDTAIKKLRLAGYLWQAYTASQMSSNGLGHRTFRLNEAPQPDTLSRSDQSHRDTATVQVLKSKYTTAEIRDPQRAQQNSSATDKNSLYEIALEAIRPEFPGDRNYIAALFLDSHYENGLVTGHAALGGGSVTAQYSLGIFGSHSLFSWPTCLESVVPCFMDERNVDRNFCSVDGEGDQYWTACNVGIGAMMHEVGHSFGCPHQRSGVMMRDYIRLSRSFTVTEPPGPPALNGAECAWHRLDLLRFRAHPCYALPSDEAPGKDDVHLFGVDEGVSVKSISGILVVEIFLEGDEFPKSWIEYVDQSPSEVILTEDDLRSRAAGEGKIKINVIALNGSSTSTDDITNLLQTEEVSQLGRVWKSSKLGEQGHGSPSAVLFPDEPLVNIRVHSGLCLDGLEFFTEQESFLFGKQGGSPHDFSVESDEFITGFGVRSGAWIDAVQIITNKRASEWFGNVNGGGQHELMVPNNSYRVCGVYGEVQNWVMQIGLQYCMLK